MMIFKQKDISDSYVLSRERRTAMTKSGTLFAGTDQLAYAYNTRSELTSAVASADANYNYAYAFDHIGNRETASEAGTTLAYTVNALNQYSTIAETEAFTPTYDADGNATLIKTSTGTWNVEYNAENRPVRWTNAATGTVITMAFDSLGRRTEYKSVTNGVQNTWVRFLYDGYCCVQILYSNAPYNVYKEFVWDPTEPVATRPLMFGYVNKEKHLFYMFDGNKNVSDVFYFALGNGVGAHYEYAPFGAITRTATATRIGNVDIVADNPFRFSSEYYDSELDLVYYNYRHYSPTLGRWLSRDPIEEQGGLNLYAFVVNSATSYFDDLGTRKRRGRQFRGTRYKTRKNAKRLQMSQGLVFCANYKRYQNGKCCRNGNIVEDSYPKNAQTVCEGFIKDYAGTAMGQSAICVAKCLSQNEEEMSKISDCANRNSARLESHVACYAKCLFVPYYGLPDGGWDVGINDLFPDYWETRILPIFE